jgi:hypothetical protein
VAYAGTLLESGAVKKFYRQALSRGRTLTQTLVAQAQKHALRRRWLRHRRGYFGPSCQDRPEQLFFVDRGFARTTQQEQDPRGDEH